MTANPSAPPTRAAATTQSPPASPVTSHGDTGLAASNSYRYRVRAVDAALNLGSYSAMASATAQSAPPPGSHDLYFNSSEPGCDGSDPTMLMCDDFEDGAWYYYSGGQNDYAAVNKGWKGESPTGPDPLGQNYGRCLPTSQGGAVGTNCSAESRNSNDGSGNQARHQLAPSATLYDDIYVRFYLFMPAGYDPYHHKLLSIGWGDALQGEQHLIVDLRAFAGPIMVPGCLMVGTLSPDREPNNTCWLDQNQGNDLVLTTNRWYYLEFHLKLNTAGQSNGEYEMWADDCGPNGLGCTGPGTLRTRFTGGAGLREAGQIKTILFEAWQNPNFSGSRYWDQVIVRTTRIGPMSMGSDATAPTVPDGLSASAVSSSQIDLSWTASTDNVGVTGYLVERCLGASCTDFRPVATPTLTSYGDTGLTASTTYRYRVRAVDAAANLSGYSAIAGDATPSLPPPGSNDLYLNSSEPGCDGSDPTMLMCDDFEDGDWYVKDFDQATSSGGLLQTDGWGGTIYANPITPPGAAVCGSKGAGGSDCAATGGYHDGSIGGRNMADHGFLGGPVDEAYVRLYFQPQSDYVGGHEKMFGFVRGSGTGQLVALCYNVFSSQTIECIPMLHQDDGLPGQAQAWMGSNVGSVVTLVPTHWYAFQMHARLNTPGSYDGSFEWWLDDCGVGGTGCTGAPTLRGRYPNVKYRDLPESEVRFGGLWIENWANPATVGTMYYDNIRVSKAGPVGFMSPPPPPPDTTAPTAPSDLSATAVSSSQIDLSWTASTDNVGVAGYRVERCLGAACTTFAPIGAPTTNAYADTGLTASTTYGYRVRATDAAGNSSGYSTIASASTQSGGGGGLTDSLIHPPPATGPYAYNTFKPGAAGFPAVGGFYTDPVFGMPVRRLTNVVGALNCDDIYAHHWANADGTYAFNRVLASGFCQDPRIISTANGAVVYSDQPAGLFGGDIYWDANDPDKYYYFSGSSLMRRNLAEQTSTTIKIFPAALQTVGQSLNIQDRTGRYFTVRYGGTNKVWDSQTNSIYAGSVTPRDAGGWTSITPDGKYLVDASAEYYSYPIDHVTQSIGPGTMFWSLCGDHGALVSASDGKSYLVTFNCYDVAGVYRVDLTLNQAGRTAAQQAAANVKLIPLDWNDAGHFSAVSKGSRSDWVFMSTESVIDFFDSSTSNWTAYKQEILVVNVVTLQVRRLAHHRSRSITVDYQTMPRVSTSWDGSLVMWVSNFDSSSPTGYADLYAIPSPLGDAPADTQGPSPPTNLAATAVSSTGIDLTWTASADNVGVTGYRVERCTGAACTVFAQIGAPTSASYSDTGLTASTAYRYQVRATDAAGNLSGYSSIASATTPAPPDTTAPVLASVFASSITQTGAAVTWTTDEPATTQVEYGLTTGYGSQTSLVSTLLTSHGASLSGLSAGTTYHYRVRSADGAGNLALSGDFALETLIPPDTTAPSAVSNLATVNPTTNAVTVTWTAPGDDGSTGTATAYEIRYSTSPITAGNFTSATNVTTPPSPKPAGGSESMTIGSLQSATTYYVALRTRDEVPNISALSNVATVTTQTVIVPDTTPPTISNIAVSAITTSAATVTWTTNEPATAEVRYGLSSTSLNRTVSVRTLQIAQSVALTGLSRNTRYYYQSRSKDAAGNERVAATRSFTTLRRLSKLAKVNNLRAPVGFVDASSQSRAAQSRQTSITISGKANPVIASWAPRSISSGRKSPRLPAQGTSAGLAAQAAERLGFTPAIETQILKISARHIDRWWKDHKRQAKRPLYGRTRPGPSYLLTKGVGEGGGSTRRPSANFASSVVGPRGCSSMKRA